MGEWSFWCASFNCWAWWAREFQGLLAGVLAIIAGSFAFGAGIVQARAARAQANAVVTVAAQRQAEARRAAAAAMYAELTSCEIALLAAVRNLRATYPVNAIAPVRAIDTPIFNAKPDAVGLLQPEVAAVVVQAYSVVHLQSARHSEAIKTYISGDELDILVRRAEQAAGIVKKALSGLLRESGFDEEKAAALREGYERSTSVAA